MIRLKRLPLTAGVPETFALSGSYFRVLSAEGTLIVKFDTGGTSEMVAGLGFAPPVSFTGFTLTSPTTQVAFIAVASGTVDDNRLAGDIDLNGVLNVVTTASSSHITHPAQSISALTEVLPLNTQRKSAMVQIDGECYVDDSTNGVLVSGSFLWESQTSLVLVPVSGTVVVRILEELN